MNLKLAGAVIILAASVAASGAQKGGKKGAGPPPGGVTITPSAPAAPATPATPAIGNIQEGQKIAEIQAIFAAGEFDKAIEAVNTFLKTARDDGAKTEAIRILADAYRKKGDWRQAATAYQRLRERFPKDSDDAMKYDGVADIMRNSPGGVYTPPGSPPAKAPAPGQTLSDDAVLADALTKLAAFRGLRMKTHINTVARGLTPQAVMAALQPMADEAKQIFCLSPSAPVDGPHEVCAAAGNRLQALSVQVAASLKAKLEKYQAKFASPWDFTNVEKADLRNAQNALKEMVDAETRFQQALPIMAGRGNWPDADRLRNESAARCTTYNQLIKECNIPPYIHDYYY